MDKAITVGQNHTESIEVNMTRNVGMNKFDTTAINSAETVGAAKELSIGGLYQISVGGVMNETVIGAKAEEVGAAKALVVANDMTEYVMGDRKTTTEGNLTRKVGKTHHIQAEEYILEAKDQLILKTANATIIMKPDSITIKGKKIAYPGPGTAASFPKDQQNKKQIYSQQFDFSEILSAGNYPEKRFGNHFVEISKPDGTHLETLIIGQNGFTNRLFTEKDEEVIAWAGDGQWEVHEEFEDIEEQNNDNE